MTTLRQSTQIKVRVGPFMDATNAITPEAGVTLAAADQAELLKANGAATVDLSGATWAAVTGADGWYDLTLTTSHTDTVGELTVVVQDESVCRPVFMQFQVVEEAVYDELYAASAGVAKAILDAATASHEVAGSFGELFALTKVDTAAILVDTGTTIPGQIGTPAGASIAADIAAINNIASVSADIISAERTWIADDYRARNIIEVKQNFAGTLALKPDLNPGVTINSVDAVSITGAASVTASSTAVDRGRTKAHIVVPALTTTGTYTVVVTITTVDGDTIPTTATLKVN